MVFVFMAQFDKQLDVSLGLLPNSITEAGEG